MKPARGERQSKKIQKKGTPNTNRTGKEQSYRKVRRSARKCTQFRKSLHADPEKGEELRESLGAANRVRRAGKNLAIRNSEEKKG